MFDIGVRKALDIKLVEQGDTIIITAGGPVGTAGTTNLLKVQTVTTIYLNEKNLFTEIFFI